MKYKVGIQKMVHTTLEEARSGKMGEYFTGTGQWAQASPNRRIL